VSWPWRQATDSYRAVFLSHELPGLEVIDPLLVSSELGVNDRNNTASPLEFKIRSTSMAKDASPRKPLK
jgi:hypothetical protein